MKKIIAPIYSYNAARIDAWQRFSIKKWDYRKLHIMHFHDCLEIFIMLRGTGTQLLNGKEYDLNGSSVTCLFINDYHAIYNLSEDSLIYNLMIDPSMISQKYLDLLNMTLSVDKYCEVSETAHNQIRSLFEFLEYSVLDEQRFDSEFYCRIINNLLEIFFKNFHYGLQESNATPNNHLQQIIFYINTHLLEDLSIEDVAQHAGYSVGYFSNYFHKEMGVRFKDYITKLRIEYAKSLLITTNHPISEIAFNSGFASIPTFMRNFSTIVGTSPNKYRKKYFSKNV